MPNPAPLLGQLSSEISSLLTSVAPSVVAIASERRSASGFFWRPDLIVSASDAIEAESGSEVDVVTASGPIRATIIGSDPATDVVLLKALSGTAAPLAMTASPALGIGAAAVLAGRSAHGPTCAVGFVSLSGEAWESMRGGRIDRRIGLDLSLRRELEGGPVLTAAGEIIGMAVSGPRRRTLVIPAATIEHIADTLARQGSIRYGYLGVASQPVRLQPETGSTSTERRTGIIVLSLDVNGPAHQAGILQGDIITGVNGKPVTSPRQLRRALGPDSVGRAIACDLVRGGRTMKLDVTVGERQVK